MPAITPKRQLIEDIRKYNVTVAETFLAQFDEAALKEYLDHLVQAKAGAIRIASSTRSRATKVRLAS